MQLAAQILVAGHRGLVGRAIVRNLRDKRVNDTSKSAGAPRKLLDVSRLRARQWQAKIPLRESIAETYCRFWQHQNELRVA